MVIIEQKLPVHQINMVGKVAFIDVKYFRGIYDTTIGSNGERTAAHEFDHLLGLGHETNPFNLMIQGFSWFFVNKSQFSSIIINSKYDGVRINKGENFVVHPITGKKSLIKEKLLHL